MPLGEEEGGEREGRNEANLLSTSCVCLLNYYDLETIAVLSALFVVFVRVDIFDFECLFYGTFRRSVTSVEVH